MISLEVFCKIAFSSPESIELLNFEQQSFKVNIKNFANHDLKYSRAVVKLHRLINQFFHHSINQLFIGQMEIGVNKAGLLLNLNKLKNIYLVMF